MDTWVYESESHNPHETLAIEEALLESLKPDEAVLYLYRHDSSVIIGRNQNAWVECRVDKLREEGGVLARRISGGGAVYHDPANLNFSFIMPRDAYDVQRQCGVILDATRKLGVNASFSGRNDIFAEGQKFSGNAFCVRRDSAFHHGTILIDTNIEKMQRYLQVSLDKLRAKGVASVRSRVVNLKTLVSDLTWQDVRDALIESFDHEYGRSRPLILPAETAGRAQELAHRNAQWDWIYGKTPQFEIEFRERFAWGDVSFHLNVRDAKISDAAVYSDAMESRYIAQLSDLLRGQRFHGPTLQELIQHSVSTNSEKILARDISRLLVHHA